MQLIYTWKAENHSVSIMLLDVYENGRQELECCCWQETSKERKNASSRWSSTHFTLRQGPKTSSAIVWQFRLSEFQRKVEVLIH